MWRACRHKKTYLRFTYNGFKERSFMKVLALILVIAPVALCQDNPARPAQLHLTIGAPGGRVALTASSMQRDLSSASTAPVIQLKGNVEIRMIACLPTGKDDAVICEGTVTLHADEAEYNEKSGEINARGNVRMTPHVPSPPK
jgi:lipopolysaccharide assembly outer membrane protein LptD (OstA)